MKYTVKKSLLLLSAVLTCAMPLSWARVHAQATPFDIIAGFTAVAAVGGQTQYCPTCYDSPRRLSTHPCSDSELKCYFFEWEFSTNDFSALPKPLRSLPAGTAVSMRYTGIKEERVGNCLVPGFTGTGGVCTTRTTLPPKEWFVKMTPNPPIPNPSTAANLPAEFNFPAFGGATGVVAGIAAPHGIPIWDGKMSYPVVIYNASRVDSTVALRVHSKIDYVAGGSVDLATVPNPISAKLGMTNRIDGLDVLLCGNVPAGKCVIFMVQATLPPGDPTNPGTVEVTVEHEPNPLELECACMVSNGDVQTTIPFDSCDHPKLRASRTDTVVSTIDPNQKWVANAQPYYHPGDEILFKIRCENVGNGRENIVYLADLFDQRLDGGQARFVSLEIRSQDGRLLRPTITPASRVVHEKHDQNLFWVEFVANQYLLGPGEYAEIALSVPIRANLDTHTGINLPSWLSQIDTQLVEIPNTAYTMFGMEGVSYEARCEAGPKLLTTVGQPNWLFWLIVLIVILLILLLLAWVWMRMRRARQNHAPAASMSTALVP